MNDMIINLEIKGSMLYGTEIKELDLTEVAKDAIYSHLAKQGVAVIDKYELEDINQSCINFLAEAPALLAHEFVTNILAGNKMLRKEYMKRLLLRGSSELKMGTGEDIVPRFYAEGDKNEQHLINLIAHDLGVIVKVNAVNNEMLAKATANKELLDSYIKPLETAIKSKGGLNDNE